MSNSSAFKDLATALTIGAPIGGGPVAGNVLVIGPGNVLSQASRTCFVSDTRANILALRTGNALSMGCYYIVNDFNSQTYLTGGTAKQILIQATDTNQLGTACLIENPWDPNGNWWAGKYDIDTDMVTEVTDNYENHYVGSYSITNSNVFGMSTVTLNEIRDSAVVVFGGTLTMQGSEITGISALLVLGGTMTFNNSSLVNGSGYVKTGAGDTVLYSCAFDGSPSNSDTHASGTSTLQYGNVRSSASLSLTATGTVTVDNFTYDTLASITIGSAGTSIYNKMNIGLGATFSHTAGDLTITGLDWQAGFFGKGGDGATTITECFGVRGFSFHNHTSPASTSMSYCKIDSFAAINTNHTSGSVSYTTSQVSGASSNLSIPAATALNSITFQDCKSWCAGFVSSFTPGSNVVLSFYNLQLDHSSLTVGALAGASGNTANINDFIARKGTITISGPTVNPSVTWQTVIINNGSLNMTAGTPTTFQNIDISGNSTFNSTSSSVQRLSLRTNFALTSGGQTINGVWCEGNLASTLTGANTDTARNAFHNTLV